MDAAVAAAAAPASSASKLDRDALLATVFKACDRDGDGSVDLAEYRAISDEPVDFLEDLFGMLDENGDGKLSQEEFIAANLESSSALSDAEFKKLSDRWLDLANKQQS